MLFLRELTLSFSLDFSVLKRYSKYLLLWFLDFSCIRCDQCFASNVSGAQRPSCRITSTSSMSILSFFSCSGSPLHNSLMIRSVISQRV